MRDNQTELISQLTPVEFRNLNTKVFSDFNQPFKVLGVRRLAGRKEVTVRLHTGQEKQIMVENIDEQD